MPSDAIVLIYGADTPLGNAVAKKLIATDKFNCVQRVSDYFTTDVVPSIHREIHKVNPSVVLNCLVDPDSGYYPHNAMERYIAPSHAMITQTRRRGGRYIYCGSARVYGQQEELVGRSGYSEYDPWMAFSDDPWRAVCQSMEASLWQQVSPQNFQAKYETEVGFEAYCLRFGHILFKKHPDDRPLDAYTLSRSIQAAMHGKQNFSCGRTNQLVSPINVDAAADAVVELCSKRPRPMPGTYNIGSSKTVTIDRLFSYLSMISRKPVCVGSVCAASADSIGIYGVDADQGLDTSFWSSRAKTQLPTWEQAVMSVVRSVCIS